jgi:hypothetical protein
MEPATLKRGRESGLDAAVNGMLSAVEAPVFGE